MCEVHRCLGATFEELDNQSCAKRKKGNQREGTSAINQALRLFHKQSPPSPEIALWWKVRAGLVTSPTFLAVKLTPKVKFMALSITDLGTLVRPVLTLVRVPMLITIMKSERTSPRISDEATGNAAVDPKLGASGGADFDLVVRVGGAPSADAGPVPGFSKGLGGDCVVEEVDVVLVGARVSAESVGSFSFEFSGLDRLDRGGWMWLTYSRDECGLHICLCSCGERA